jgi:hypothetical protein
MAKSKNEQLSNLGKNSSVRGALIREVKSGQTGSDIAAEVVLVMANEIGRMRAKLETPTRPPARYDYEARDASECYATLILLAGKLGVEHALRQVLNEPYPETGERVISPPDEIANNPEAVAIQLAILSAVDQQGTSAEMPGRGKPLMVFGGGSGIDSALDDFEDI